MIQAVKRWSTASGSRHSWTARVRLSIPFGRQLTQISAWLSIHQPGIQRFAIPCNQIGSHWAKMCSCFSIFRCGGFLECGYLKWMVRKIPLKHGWLFEVPLMESPMCWGVSRVSHCQCAGRVSQEWKPSRDGRGFDHHFWAKSEAQGDVGRVTLLNSRMLKDYHGTVVHGRCKVTFKIIWIHLKWRWINDIQWQMMKLCRMCAFRTLEACFLVQELGLCSFEVPPLEMFTVWGGKVSQGQRMMWHLLWPQPTSVGFSVKWCGLHKPFRDNFKVF